METADGTRMASRSVLAPALDLTLALSGRQRGDEEQEREQEGGASDQRFKNSGPRVRGAAGTPRKRLEGAFGARFRLRSLADAGTREVKRLTDFCTLTPFPGLMRGMASERPVLRCSITQVVLEPLRSRQGAWN